MNTFNKGILLLSNQYSQICNLYKCQVGNETTNVMSYETGIKIIDNIIDNAQRDNVTPIFYLIGGDNIMAWTIITKKIISYINSKDIYSRINLQIEQNISELKDFKDFINQYHNINLNILYNDITTAPFLEEFITLKPFAKILYKITVNNYNNIYNDYLKLNKLQIKNLHFLFELTGMEQPEFNIENIYQQFYKIKNFIIEQFENNIIPLIPDNITDNFIKIVMKNQQLISQEKYNYLTIFFHHAELMTYHCDMMIGKKIIINWNGELFLCSKDTFDNTNKFYYGTIDNPKPTDKIFENIFKIPKEEANSLQPVSTELRCSRCHLYHFCNIDCFANNECYSNNPLKPNKLYCAINNALNRITIELIQKLDNEKNELFKNYFYIHCQKGLRPND